MRREEIKLNEGGRVVSHDLSQEEIDDANERTRIEKTKNDIQNLIQARKDATQAELEKLVDIEHGTTKESIAFRNLRLRNDGQ